MELSAESKKERDAEAGGENQQIWVSDGVIRTSESKTWCDFNGGPKQRVAIANALTSNPRS